MVEESPLRQGEHGLVATGPGWFVVDARDSPWYERDGRGAYCAIEEFEGANESFAQLGINITVVGPGEPMSMYHYENDQEDFLVVAGEGLLIVEGEERTLRAWDFVHCPAGTNHVIVGAGDTPCVVVAVGARERSTGPEWGAYTVDAAAIRHDAGVDRETADPDEAYARFGRSAKAPYREGRLP
jgi:uncharacterized cupin superfamily protein